MQEKHQDHIHRKNGYMRLEKVYNN